MIFDKVKIFLIILIFPLLPQINNSLRIPKIATLDSNKLFATIKKDVVLLQFLANPTNRVFTNIVKKEYEMYNEIEIVSNALIGVTEEVEMNFFLKRINEIKKRFYERNKYIVNDHIRDGKFRRSIKRKIFAIIKRIIDSEGYNILIDKSKLFYIDKEFDITERLLKKLEKMALQNKNLIIEKLKRQEPL